MPALNLVAGGWSRSIPSGDRIAWLIGCLACVIVMPTTVLLIGPLVLGAPHLLSELRVLGQRVHVSRPGLALIAAPLAIMIVLRIGEMSGWSRPASSDVLLGCAAMFVAAVIRPGAVRDRVARMLIVLGISVFALHDTRLTTLLLAHFHNLIALLFLFAWSRATRGSRDFVALVCGLMLAAGLLGLAAASSEPSVFVTDLRLVLAPGLSAQLGYWLVLVYALAQLLHYVVWLVWIPRASAVVRPPDHKSYDAFPVVLIIAALGLPLLAMLWNPIAIRDQYLALSSFHGWLELTVLMYCGLSAHAD